MSKADDDLREMAANRGYRLVKSRVRTPGRRDYGKFGLKHAETGEEAFGFSRHRLAATAAQIEDFLRSGAAEDWKESVRKTKRAKPPARA